MFYELKRVLRLGCTEVLDKLGSEFDPVCPLDVNPKPNQDLVIPADGRQCGLHHESCRLRIRGIKEGCLCHSTSPRSLPSPQAQRAKAVITLNGKDVYLGKWNARPAERSMTV